MWLRDNMPDVFSKTKKIISIKEYIFKKLFDKYLIDYSIASATGLFDIYKKSWYEPSLKFAGITQEQLSEAVSPTHIIRGIKQEYAQRLGIDKDLPFIIGASDGCLANLGSNAVNPGDVSLTIGTSGAVRMLTNTPQKDSKRRLFNYLLTDELYVSGGPINNGGVLLKWYAENFLDREFTGAADFEWFLQEAIQVAPGSEGLIFLPYVQGERAPVWDADAKGVFLGIHSGHTRAHFMRAIIEGICFALYQVAGSLEEVIAPIKNIYASGGFIQSKQWLQMLTDIFGKRISITDTADASAVGAAILGMKATGMISDISEAASTQEIKEVFEPDMQKHELYRVNYAVYTSLYEKLKDEFAKLSV
jgi:gluconokinase